MAQTLCLIFDCDGTLVDSEPLLAETLEQTLTEAGLPFKTHRYMDEFRGVQYAKIREAMEAEHGVILDEARRQQTERIMRARLHERMATSLTPIAGVEAALEALDAPCCVASNGPLAKIELSMRTSGLGRFFGDNLFSAYEIGAWKPDPELYRHAGRAMGFPPERCVVIDDAAVGVEAGLAAGMQVIHLNRFAEHETTPEGAHALARFVDLPALVARLQRELESTVQ